MDLHGYKFLIFINSIFVIGALPSFYNETYDGYTLIVPLTDGETRSPLTLPSSFAEQWCSRIGATFQRITNESDQKDIVQFIGSAVRKYNLSRIQTIFVNHINHTVGDYTWGNGQTNQGFSVRQVSNNDGADRYFGYLWAGDYRISESKSSDKRRYICETPEHSSNSSHCEIKLDKRCYWKKDVALTWYKARNACLKEGGDLASFEKLNERILKVSLKDLNLTASSSYWIGIYNGVWRWNDNGIDSEIKYSNWKPGHPSNYSAKCLCLDKQHNDYYWIECECNKEYPFICKRNDSELKYSDWKPNHPSNDSSKCLYPNKQPNGYEWIECECDMEYPFTCKGNETSSQSPLPIDPMPNTSVVPKTTARILTTKQMPITSVISETTALSLPVDQMPHTSVISETVRLALVLSSCALIVVIVIFAIAAFIIRKQRNRPMRSSRYETSEAATNEFPIYNEIEEPRENKSSANCSASSPPYATVKRPNSMILVENSLYGDLDL